MKIILFLFYVLCLSVNTQAQCTSFEFYNRCDYNVDSKEVGIEVPVFIFTSKDLDHRQSTPVVFLHGRGYARQMGGAGSMLEHADLNNIFKTYSNKFVFIAPQDIVVQEDSKSIGNDYWLGNEDRNWQTFLGHELPQYLYQNHSFNLENLSILGISMGAHGSLMTGSKFPEVYKSSIALSPVFRSIETEVPENDRDIFLQKGLDLLDQFSFGSKILSNTAVYPIKTYIEIDVKDFGLDQKSFPASPQVWSSILDRAQDNPDLEATISKEGSGHSMSFWKPALLRSLNWLENQ